MTRLSRRNFMIGTAGALAMPALIRSANASDEIVIGAVVPLTGPFAPAGIQYHNSLRTAEADINAAGGINGKTLRIVFEDTGPSNSTSVNAFIKLNRQLEPSFIFLSSIASQNLATEQQVTRAEVPTMYAGSAVELAEGRNPWMFSIRPSIFMDGDITAYGVTEVLKTSKPGVMHTADDYGSSAANTAIAALEKRGVQIVAREQFSPMDNDFSAQLFALKNAGADSVVAFTYNRDGALIMKQRRSLGIDLPFLCGSAFFAPATFDLIEPDDVEGVFATGDAVLGAGISPESETFVKRYTEQWGFGPDGYGSSMYDGALIVAAALREVGPDRVAIQGYLRNLKDFKGVTRTYTCDDRLSLAHTLALAKFKPGTKDLELVTNFPVT